MVIVHTLASPVPRQHRLEKRLCNPGLLAVSCSNSHFPSPIVDSLWSWARTSSLCKREWISSVLLARWKGNVVTPSFCFQNGRTETFSSSRLGCLINGRLNELFRLQGYIFEYSALFYGYYDSGQGEPHWPPPANPQPYIGLFYRLPLAYLLVIFALFVLCVVALLSK